jgi:hypothetical protein
MPSKSLEALSIVVQHETNEILIDQTSLKQQQFMEQHKYWTKLKPGEMTRAPSTDDIRGDHVI